MISISPPSDELAKLLEASCLGEILPEQTVRLQELVCGDSECRVHYLLFMHMHAMIERRAGPGGNHAAAMLEAAVPVRSPAPTLLATTLHTTLGYFPEGMPLAYLIATVVTGLGLLIGSHDLYVPSGTSGSTIGFSPLSSLRSPHVVGRITGMVDCKWEKEGIRVRGIRVVRGAEKSDVQS